jgi:hypothetical protein
MVSQHVMTLPSVGLQNHVHIEGVGHQSVGKVEADFEQRFRMNLTCSEGMVMGGLPLCDDDGMEWMARVS